MQNRTYSTVFLPLNALSQISCMNIWSTRICKMEIPSSQAERFHTRVFFSPWISLYSFVRRHKKTRELTPYHTYSLAIIYSSKHRLFGCKHLPCSFRQNMGKISIRHCWKDDELFQQGSWSPSVSCKEQAQWEREQSVLRDLVLQCFQET